MRRYGRDYAEETFRRGGRRRPPPHSARAWLAEPVGGRVGYDRMYGGYRGARYGARYDLGYAPLSDLNPLARQLRRGYHELAPDGGWRGCGPGRRRRRGQRTS